MQFIILLALLAIFPLVGHANHTSTPPSTGTLKKLSLVSDPETPLHSSADTLPVWINLKLTPSQEIKPLLSLLQDQIGQPLTQATLDAVKNTISTYFLDNLHLLTAVLIPPQDISDGNVQIILIQGTIDEIELIGNRWTSNRFLLARTKLKQGAPLQINQLETNLAWLNRSPFRRTDLLLRPGKEAGTTTAQLITHERFPVRPYIGGDNTGTEFTTHARWFTGFNAGNLWGCDQQISYQFTTASDPQTFMAHNATYTIPFPWKHQLYTYGGWSKIKGDLPEPDMNHTGVNWQISTRYQIPINPIYGKFLQELTFGYDFKRTDTGLAFGEATFSKSYADINQFLIGYYLNYRSTRFTTSLNTELFVAPIQITADQNSTDYQKIRAFAESKYGYGRIRISHIQYLPYQFRLKASLIGQGTGWNLMPSEQFGIGGYDTVRGYEERGFNADNALLASIEINTPPTPLFDWRKNNPRQEKLQFLAFIDYGWGQLHQPDDTQQGTEWMLGIGPGIRYFNSTNLLFRADLGFPLNKAGLGRQGIHLHIGGTLSF